jgi:arylsulfatase A-like enzyme
MVASPYPNIVLLLVDSARYDRLGFNGYARAHTPVMDKLARESVVYSRAYAPAPWTLPVVASLFTGLNPFEHGLHFDRRSLEYGVLTLPRILSALGYQTLGASGNPWLTSNTALTAGFDEMRLIDRLFDTRPPRRWQVVVEKLYKRLIHPMDSGGRRLAELASHWLRNCQRDRPFFLFLHYMEPHGPYKPAWQWAEPLFSDRQEYRAALKVADVELDYLACERALEIHELDGISRLYDALIASVDHYIGQVVDALKSLGFWDNSLVIVTSDHGENLGDHGLLGHQYCLYDSLLHVPLLIRFPDCLESVVRSELVLNSDLFATLLARLDCHESHYGPRSRWVDLHPLAQSDIPEHVFALYERPMIERFRRRYPETVGKKYDHELRSIRSEQYKLIQRDDGHVELYDIGEDPNELHNLADEQPEIVRYLKAELEAEMHSWRRDGAAENDADVLDQITLGRLRGLGYLE